MVVDAQKARQKTSITRVDSDLCMIIFCIQISTCQYMGSVDSEYQLWDVHIFQE